MIPIVLVLTTVATRAEAERLARAMLERRLAACAQISAIDSVYRWQGALQAEGEFRLLFKTTATRCPALQAALRAGHPYELPAIVSLPCSDALPEFAAWVEDETRPV
ncbi:MAG: divalent-cation tolerance protein CutA [Burkholderiaceae bacterium]|nr:divalent-cation tolerance protein CutA [Burkholderiaceae bacterium]